MKPERAQSILRDLAVWSDGVASSVLVPVDVVEELRGAGCLSPTGDIDMVALVALARGAERDAEG